MSKFIVSARKYRPQRFDEVVGQEHVSKTLKNALQTDHLAHAFLFCGPRGVGKTTCARILAKVLNCENPTDDFEPCNKCNSCKAFNEQASFNITELDAASNNSVEHIRALIEQVRFQPQQGQYKVFIIDEVHMLSPAAFNAFLKTLEEPPSYAIFILATTEKHKIIPTILSRCQIFDFRRIQVGDMVAHLAEICTQESIAADADALHIIGQKADGALRDALSIFDRIVSFSGKKITYEDVIINLNVLDYDYYFRVVDTLLSEDRSALLLLFDEILRKGFDPDIFINGLAEHIRNLLVCKDPQTLSLLEISDGLRDRYQEQARLSPTDLLLTVLNLVNDCDLQYKLARNKRLHVEMNLIKMSSVKRAFRLSEGQVFVPSQEESTVLSPEKKTADLSARPASKAKTESIDPTARAPEPDLEESGDLHATKPSEHPTTEPTDQTPHGSEQGKTRRRRAARMIESLSQEAHLAEIEEASKQAQSNVESVDITEVQAAWNRYTEAVERDTLRIILRAAQLSVEKLDMAATVGTNLAASAIREASDLMEFLRKELKAPQLTMRIEVDEALRPADTKRPRNKVLSAKEKYLLMRESNPAVEELRKRFDLRPDE